MIISVIFLCLAAILDAIQDTLKSKFNTSIFKNLGTWWNPELSWVNKWAVGSTTKERFLASSTIFVFITDAWHFFKMLMLFCMFTSIVTYAIQNYTIIIMIMHLIIFSIVWGIFFEITYRILNKK